MNQPLLALFLAGLLALALVLIFWPTQGLVWRLRTRIRPTGRVLLEDALKHLYDCEYRNAPCTLQSLSGALHLSGNRTARLLADLEERELVRIVDAKYRLTEAGRRDALRVVRVHRLWEQYFSEETGLKPTEWHQEAERREHLTSPAETQALSARMGHPRYDPHGDPIPTASGDLPPRRGRPITDLEVGQIAEIVHLEDEPQSVYEALLACEFHLGMRVKVIESSIKAIRFEGASREFTLPPVVASNLTVIPLPDEEMAGPFDPLSDLEPGHEATVMGISARCRGVERRRLLDLGIVPGTVVRAELSSAAGDPTAYRIRGALIALRKEQAVQIYVARGPQTVVS